MRFVGYVVCMETVIFYSLRHDLLCSHCAWTIAVHGRHTFTRAHFTRIDPVGLPDSGYPPTVVSNLIRQSYASSYFCVKVLESLDLVCI